MEASQPQLSRGVGLTSEADSHFTCASDAKKCRAHVPMRELIRNIMSQCLSGIHMTGATCDLGLCGRPLAACPPRKQNISETSPGATARLSP